MREKKKEMMRGNKRKTEQGKRERENRRKNKQKKR